MTPEANAAAVAQGEEVELDVRTGDGGTVMRWSVANRADTDVTVRSVAAVYAVDAAEPVRMLRHGYQSWSPTGAATLGHDADPSTRADLPFLQAVHHADQRTVVAPGELRSEWLTVLADLHGGIVVGGFDGAGLVLVVRDRRPWFLVEVTSSERTPSPALDHFQAETGAEKLGRL